MKHSAPLISALKRAELVPAEPFRRIIEDKIDHYTRLDHPNPEARVAFDCDLDRRILYRITSGEVKKIEFTNADKIVTFLAGAMLWHTDDELNEIYTSVELKEIEHGTRSMYTRNGCRCAPCKTANTEYSRRYERRKKAVA